MVLDAVRYDGALPLPRYCLQIGSAPRTFAVTADVTLASIAATEIYQRFPVNYQEATGFIFHQEFLSVLNLA